MPLTTSELFAQVIKERGWYKPAGIGRVLAARTKANFKKGILSEAKQTEILLKLGYKIESQQMWKSS